MTHAEICAKLDNWDRAQFMRDMRKFGCAVVGVSENGGFRAIAFDPNTYAVGCTLRVWDDVSKVGAAS